MEAVIDFFTPARCIELLGLLTGLCYLWFEYHANPLVWLVGIVMPMISMWVYFYGSCHRFFHSGTLH